MSKKITGYIFIAIAIILGLAVVGQLPKLLSDISAFLKIFTGNMETYDISYAIGTLVCWFLLILLAIVLWNEGQKRVKTGIDKNNKA